MLCCYILFYFILFSSLSGPLHTKNAVKDYTNGLKTILEQGGKILTGGKPIEGLEGNFVEPTIIAINHEAPIVKEELFVPILYVLKCKVPIHPFNTPLFLFHRPSSFLLPSFHI